MVRSIARIVLAGALVVLGTWAPGGSVAPSLAQAERPEIEADLERLKADVEAMKRELAVIREMLSRLARPAPRAPTVAEVGVAGRPALGTVEAPVTVVEFSDYQCPFCARFFRTTLPALKAEYVDTGKVRYVFRDFPLDQIHPQARKAAEAARCAGEQGKYWEMHDTLFQNQQALGVGQLKAHARRLALDAAGFDACLDRGRFAGGVQKDLDDGIAAGVRGTPAFVVGRTRSDGMVEGTLVTGAQPVQVFRQVIDRLLRESKD